MANLDNLDWIALILVLVGGVDVGLYGLFQFHILEVFFGSHFLGRILYILIGVSAGYLIYQKVKKKTVKQ